VEFLFGATQRDFGADGFYSSRFTSEEEHISQQFYQLKVGQDMGDYRLVPNVYLRRHVDKFILNRHNPAFYTNLHTTYVWGSNIEAVYDDWFLVQASCEQEIINSTNLKKHDRFKNGMTMGLRNVVLDKFTLDTSFSLDYSDSRRWLENANFVLRYALDPSIGLQFDYDHLWRAPSFTELYYNDPSNRGNNSLGIQQTDNFQFGVDYSSSWGLGCAADIFLREQKNTIDWGKNTSLAVWQATNVGDLSVRGFDLKAAMTIESWFKNISAAYTYLDISQAKPYIFSKYVFDYSRHKLEAALKLAPKFFTLDLLANFSKPMNRSSYPTFDLVLGKNINQLTVSLEGTNIFNKKYYEMDGIVSGGRWFKLCARYDF